MGRAQIRKLSPPVCNWIFPAFVQGRFTKFINTARVYGTIISFLVLSLLFYAMPVYFFLSGTAVYVCQIKITVASTKYNYLPSPDPSE